MSSDRTLVAML